MAHMVWKHPVSATNSTNVSKHLSSNQAIGSISNVTKFSENESSSRNHPESIISGIEGISEGIKRDIQLFVPNTESRKHQNTNMNQKCLNVSNVLKLDKISMNPASSVSSVSGLTPLTDSATSALMKQCSDNWLSTKHNIKVEEKQNKKRVETYVKHYLFKDLKFISSPEMMVFEDKEESLNYLVCHNLNIQPEHHQIFWEKYSKSVEKAINAARNDSVQAMKRSFLKGKISISIV